MNRLLKESAQKTTENRHPRFPKDASTGNHSSLSREMYQIDSPFDALEPNRITTFAMR